MNDDNQPEKPVHKPSKHNNRKRWIIVGALVLLFAVGAVGGWLYNANNQKIKEDKALAQQEKNATTIKNAENDANAVVYDGGSVYAAGTIYDKAIKQSVGDSNLRYSLLMGKSVLYLNNNNYNEALKIALQVEAVKKTSDIEQYIAQIYRLKGDKLNAIKYYKSAISQIDKTLPMSESDAKSFQNKITELGG